MKPLTGPHEGEPNTYGPTYWYSTSDGNLVILQGSGGFKIGVRLRESANMNGFLLFNRAGEVRVSAKNGTYFQTAQAAMDAIAGITA